MLKKEYYCLVAGLPNLFFKENRLSINWLDFRTELKSQLNQDDYQLIEYLFLPFDNENLIHLIFNQNKPFNSLGLISKTELEYQLSPEKEGIELPAYITQFLNWQQKNEENNYSVLTENKLHWYFYEYAIKTRNIFLRAWLNFDLNVKNIFTAFNCFRFGYELSSHLVKTEQNKVVCSLLTSKSLNPEFFDDELPFSHQIFKIAKSDLSLIEKEKALDKIRWDYLDENTFFHFFTIEKILSYTIKLLITERWLKLESETGKAVLNRLINDLKTSYEFPVEFSLSK